MAENADETPSSRAAKAEALSGGLLRVVLAKRTLEYELYLKNEELLTSTYKELHPRTNLGFTGTIEEKAAQFADKVHANRDKALFAQKLAGRLEYDESSSVVVPEYIENAIRWAVKGEWADDDAS